VKHLADLRAITFPRAAKPREPVIGKPILMIFGTDPPWRAARWRT
jgi:hypothetical protein